MVSTWKELDGMSRLLYLESKSLDELEELSKNKEMMAEAIPAIWPVNKRNLRGHIGAFGTRRHPVTGRIAGHQGIDLGGRVGDPVYATGNGRVAFNNEGERGYGKQVLINHGFGYKTRYAHLSKILVAPGAISAANRAIYFSVSTRFCALCGRNTHLEILMLLPLFSPRPVGP